MTHDLQWFIDRIGKKVYRDTLTCECDTCKSDSVFIMDRFHANYLYDIQNEMGINYYEKTH